MKKIYVFLADGFEEIEGLTVVDILRRGNVETITVSVNAGSTIHGSHGITLEADTVFEDCSFDDAGWLVLPGGMPGTLHLKEHEGLRELLLKAGENGTGLAAICAAPSVLGELGLLKGLRAACHPGFEEKLEGAAVEFEDVVCEDRVITSRGMGTAIPFALSLLKRMAGKDAAEKVAEGIIYKGTIA